MAAAVVVNSHFTAGVFRDTFQSLSVRPEVLYPSLNFEAFDRPALSDQTEIELGALVGPGKKDHFIYLSINRYERKKNLPLAIQAFGKKITKEKINKTNNVFAFSLQLKSGPSSALRSI